MYYLLNTFEQSVYFHAEAISDIIYMIFNRPHLFSRIVGENYMDYYIKNPLKFLTDKLTNIYGKWIVTKQHV